MSLLQVLHLLKLLAAIVVTGAGTVLAAAYQGAIILPPGVQAALLGIVSVGAGLGIASPGLAKPSAPLPASDPANPNPNPPAQP